MQAAKRDEDAARAVVISDAIGAAGVGDVDLNDDEIGLVVEGQGLDVLVNDGRLVVGRQVGGERGETERREERVLDRPPERAGGLGERRKDELDGEGAAHGHALYCKAYAWQCKACAM